MISRWLMVSIYYLMYCVMVWYSLLYDIIYDHFDYIVLLNVCLFEYLSWYKVYRDMDPSWTVSVTIADNVTVLKRTWASLPWPGCGTSPYLCVQILKDPSLQSWYWLLSPLVDHRLGKHSSTRNSEISFSAGPCGAAPGCVHPCHH